MQHVLSRVKKPGYLPFRAVLSSFSVNMVYWLFHCLLIRFCIHINHAAEGGWRSDASDIVPIKFTLQLFKGIKQFSQVESVLGLLSIKWNCFKIVHTYTKYVQTRMSSKKQYIYNLNYFQARGKSLLKSWVITFLPD